MPFPNHLLLLEGGAEAEGGEGEAGETEEVEVEARGREQQEEEEGGDVAKEGEVALAMSNEKEAPCRRLFRKRDTTF